jgi:Family of unknown function (DUF6448)
LNVRSVWQRRNKQPKETAMNVSRIPCCPRVFITVLIGCAWLVSRQDVRAHCDSEKGPVIQEARVALEKGDPVPLLKWVKPEREAEIREAFALARQVRGKGGEAGRLADRWFVETVVRIHRAGEGATYTGISNEDPAPILILADKALAEGNAAPVIAGLGKALEEGIRIRHQRVVEAAMHKDCCVEGGRAYVAAYVDYLHHVERVNALLSPTAAARKADDRPVEVPQPDEPEQGADPHRH